MEDNLIRDIGAAEEKAAEIVSSARERESLRLKKTEEDLADRARDLEIRFAEEKKSEREKAAIRGKGEAAEIEKKISVRISHIEKEGMKRKEEVIAFLINKITE